MDIQMTRNNFEIICDSLLKKAKVPVIDALLNADLEASQIDKVLLVGGSSRIAKIGMMMEEMFPGKVITTLNRDLCVAEGATLLAGILQNGESESFKDVVPMSLGTDQRNDGYAKIIQRGTEYPCERTWEFSTTSNNQTSMKIEVLQGDGDNASTAIKLASTKISGLPPNPKGVEKARITFSIDANGLLTVKAKSVTDESNCFELAIESESINLTRQQIQELKVKAGYGDIETEVVDENRIQRADAPEEEKKDDVDEYRIQRAQ